MANKPEIFVLAQLSDLHCSDGQLHLDKPSHKHDENLLVGVEQILAPITDSLDRVLVTGDLSNYGDIGSLAFARMWLTNRVAIRGGNSTGLSLPPPKLCVIPGNHDAWNNQKTGSLANRLQRAIKNYNSEFPQHQMPPEGCSYDWIEKGDDGVYLAFLNSCHLADSDKYKDVDRVGIGDKIARGKVTVEQSDELLLLHEMALRGKLENPRFPGTFIDAGKYAKSLKILVMHHYLFQPSGDKRQKTLEMHQVKQVFRNLAFGDFDILLCGHKHVSKPHFSKYGEHFDNRARHRYAWNCFRSHLGLSALPDQFVDDRGSFWSRNVSDTIKSLLSIFSKPTGGVIQAAHLDELCTTLKAALESPEKMKEIISEYAKRENFSGAPIMPPEELRELRKRLRSRFNKTEREKLKPICDDIMRRIIKLDSRDFVQVICGATTKAFNKKKNRSFNTYRIWKSGDEWNCEVGEYVWQHEVNRFDGPVTRTLLPVKKT